MQHPGNHRVLSMGTYKGGNLVMRGHFHADSASGAQLSTHIACHKFKGTCELLEDNNE